jgi:acetylornithine/N-succinyldiaminopimelate aminotransferase
MSDALMSTYKRLPVLFERGEGVWLWDDQGRRYLDALAGVAVCGLGHAHPALAAALCEQAGRLIHTSNIYRIGEQERLGALVTDLAGMDRVFFANSGPRPTRRPSSWRACMPIGAGSRIPPSWWRRTASTAAPWPP